MTVQTTKARWLQWKESVDGYGLVAPWQAASITSQVTGEAITELFAEVGDAVEKGQLLVQLDERDAIIEVKKAKASLVEAKANLLLAEADLERFLHLSRSKSVSKAQLLQGEVAVKSAKAKIDARSAELEAAQLLLARCKIRAPENGVLLSRSANVGDVVSNGTELFTFIRKGRLEWRVQLTAEQLRWVHPGQLVDISLNKHEHVSGTVRKVGRELSSASSQATVYVDVDNDDRVWAGMFLEGSIAVDTTSALVVPESAIVFKDGNQYVMTVDKQSSIHQVQIQTGRHLDGHVEVLSGLEGDENVVREGGSFLLNGEFVNLVANSSPYVESEM
ncbi:MexH family multidrug efflux RND transporter periplasmic adaptor subunit (plasmid) [Alteromonas sp. I4]|nr:MexH family multidrug efflux RND transporter periplasmic adaptor subunit [Alteromonas sp. I4]